jgi:UDP-N-acetylmuramyl pentapeptide phosphotransferase/UDP-N-acetylglucosamine-1-phosphate transferase
MFDIYSSNFTNYSSNFLMYIIITLILFASILVYFRVANRYGILDKPNERSSHVEVTIRGGGVIYLVSAFLALLLHPSFLLPCIALYVIGVISFLDDRITLSSRIRILFHVLAVSIVLFNLEIFSDMEWWSIVLLYIVVIGIINAYNFMDGINGITGSYTLIVLAGLQYVNKEVLHFVNDDFVWLPMLASLVFLFFNFRKKAKCFAGDVGSITMALWIVYLLLSLISRTGEYKYLLFLSVYGVDSVLTIVHRLKLKQNIFQPHRLHFYQILANETKVSHLLVSSIYALVQLLVIAVVVLSSSGFLYLFLVTTLPLIICYIVLKPLLMVK